MPKKQTKKVSASKKKTGSTKKEVPEKKQDVIDDGAHHFTKKILEPEVVQVTEEPEVEKPTKPKKKKSRTQSNKFGIDEKAVEEKITSDLNSIYRDGEGNLPDMKSFIKRKRKSTVTAFAVFVLACLFFGSIAWIGFTVMQPTQTFSEDDVILSISGPEEVRIGEEVSYRVRYRNAQNIGIRDAKLEVRYPENFEFTTSTLASADEDHEVWDIGNVDPQSSGYFDIVGKIYGDLETDHSFRIFLDYEPENFSSVFQKVANVTTKITESLVSLTIEGPAEITPGTAVTYEVVVGFEEDTELPSSLQLVLDSGPHFSVQSTGSESIQSSWDIDLAHGLVVQVTGSYASNFEGELEPLAFSVVGIDVDDEEVVLLKKTTETKLLDATVSLGLAINGSTDSVALGPGDFLTMSITLKNDASVDLTDLETRLVIDGPSANKRSIFAWNDINDVLDGDIVGEQLSDTERRGEITWKARHNSDFETFASGDKISIDVRLPVKDSGEVDLVSFETHTAYISVEARYRSGEDIETIASNQVEVHVHSDAELEVRSESIGGDTHNVTWLLTNSFHELADIELSVELYGDVAFSEDDVVVPAGSVVYDAEEKKLTWNIEKMPTSLDVHALQFPITLKSQNPSQTNLTSHVRGKAKDAVTGHEIVLVGDEIKL